MPLIGVDRADIRPGLRIPALKRRIVIAYQASEGRIEILRIFSAGRDYQAIMGD